MKYLLIIILVLQSTIILSQEQKEITTSFKKKIASVNSALSKEPLFMITENFPNSKSGELNYLIKIVKLDLSYDIQNTNSIVSPYTSYMLLKIRIYSNVGFGNIQSAGFTWGFETKEQAREIDSLASCTGTPEYNSEEWCIGNIKINYAFQDGIWVFKGIDPEIEGKIKNGSMRRNIQENLSQIVK